MLLYGGAVRLAYDAPISEPLRSESSARYDLRRLEGIESSDPIQDVSETIPRASARFDLIGPTGWTIGGHSLDWRGTIGYAHLLGDTEDLLGFSQFVEVGLGVETPLPDEVPLASGASVRGTVLFGDDVFGWSIGIGISF